MDEITDVFWQSCLAKPNLQLWAVCVLDEGWVSGQDVLVDAF